MDSQWVEILVQRVIPVVVIEDSTHARPLGEALLAGGLRTVEVTLRTAASEAALSTLAQIEGLSVGAGTVLDPAQLERAASLISTPMLGTLENVVGEAQSIPPWEFGIGSLIENLRTRELLAPDDHVTHGRTD